MQIVRTTFRADGTPISKTLTIQGGSTALVMYRKPEDVEGDEALPAPDEPAVPAPRGPVRRTVRTYLVGVEDSPQTKIGRPPAPSIPDGAAPDQPPRQAPSAPGCGGGLRRRAARAVRGLPGSGVWFDLTPLGDPATVVIGALAELGLDIRTSHREEQSGARATDRTGG